MPWLVRRSFNMIGFNQYVINFGFQLLPKIFNMFSHDFVQVFEFSVFLLAVLELNSHIS